MNHTAQWLFSAGGWWITIWLASHQDNVLKQGSIYSPKFIYQLPTRLVTAVLSCLWSELSRIWDRCFTECVTKNGQTPLFGLTELPSSTVRREHLCFGEWAMFVLRRSNRLPAAIRGDSLCHGPSKERDRDGGERNGMSKRGGGNPCIESSCRNSEGKSSFLWFSNIPSARPAISLILWITHLPRAAYNWAKLKIESFTFKMIIAMKVMLTFFEY